ncbi:MAG TPA: hypothetical protein VF043_38435 [Ktedonobacteraceae bacterium]
MGIYLSQLPAAELARLKAELAETLIANFCYPRFFDYRTNSLRMRPVDRSKRQDVWLFLGTMDFTAWNRIELMSPDFQRQIERLFIHFVQRNRSFFGEQGRKRMADVRMLINTSSQSVVDGFRGHLTSRQSASFPFGNPRPVSSWAIATVTGYPELKWEQIVSGTMLLQQQLQEVRGEIKSAIAGDTRPALAAPRRVTHGRSTANGSIESEVPSVMPQQGAHFPPSPSTPMPPSASMQRLGTRPQGENSSTVIAQPAPKNTNPFPPPATSSAAPVVPPVDRVEPPVAPDLNHQPLERVNHMSVSGNTAMPGKSGRKEATEAAVSPAPQPQAVEQVQIPAVPGPLEPRELSRTAYPAQASLVEVPSKPPESTTIVLSDEDVVIFEQMRFQLLTWLRIEAIQAGLDITGQGPGQLVELLKRVGGLEETRLQVVSSLLNISHQVITSGKASLIDYKQAMMFYLMHTRRSR